MDYSLRVLTPRYLQRKAPENLMEHPFATSNDFSTHIVQNDVPSQVCSSILNVEEHTIVELVLLGQEMRTLLTELQEHWVNAVESNCKSVDPNQKREQSATQVCKYWCKNRHTPSLCGEKIQDE